MQEVKVSQKHYGTGDNIGGNKIVKQNFFFKKDVPNWLAYAGFIVSLFELVWIIYTYLNPITG